MIVDAKKLESCTNDYSKWLDTIPDQLGWSIEQGNKIFEKLKKKALKKISINQNMDLSILEEYYK